MAFCRLVLRLAFILGLALLSSCVPPAPDHLRDLGNVMDVMAAKEAEWGTMSISAPQLANPSDVFKFSITPTSQDFYTDAKTQVQGRLAEFQQTISSSGFGANISIDMSAAAAFMAQVQQLQQATVQNAIQQSFVNQKQTAINSAAMTNFNQAMASAQQQADPATRQQMIATAIQNLNSQMTTPGPTTLPALVPPTPTTAPSDLVKQPTSVINELASGDGGKAFAAFQGLLGNATAPTLADRDALVTAAGDTAVKAMFQILGDPKLEDTFRTKRVLFGVVNVSVNPGWRTRKNYAADLAMTCAYDKVEARASVYQWFIRNTRIPAKLRVKLALDQGFPPPLDKASQDLIWNAKQEFAATPKGKAQANARQGARPTHRGHFMNWLAEVLEPRPLIQDFSALSTDEKDQLRVDVNDVQIPGPYQASDDSSSGPLVSAVAPMTATQTLSMQNSYRNQQEIALQIALQLRLMGQQGQAEIFENYVKNLQQDFSTVNQNVIANSFSTAGTFGFQVGPSLQAIESAKAGSYSGPAKVLDRQSFPALVIFGFEANDISPKVKVGDDGSLSLQEVQVHLLSAHNWVPINGEFYGDRTRLSESERLQLSYWTHQYDDRLQFADIPAGTLQFAQNRLTNLRDKFFGAGAHFTLPMEIIAPPQHPQITNVEPENPDLGNGATTVLLAGTDLDAIDPAQISAIDGTSVVLAGADAPKLVGNAISLKVTRATAKANTPLILKMTTIYGDTVYSNPIYPRHLTMPMVFDTVPNTVDLATAQKGFNVVITGSNLSKEMIDFDSICTSDCNVAKVSVPKESGEGKEALSLTITALKPGTVAIQLPLLNHPGQFIYSKPITINSGKYVVERHTIDSKGASSNDQLVFPAGTAIGTLQILGGSTSKTGGTTGGDTAKPQGNSSNTTLSLVNTTVTVGTPNESQSNPSSTTSSQQNKQPAVDPATTQPAVIPSPPATQPCPK
ncbi:MAG TPA: hypothetical protein VFW23_10695 [Tepidisphaeraceae bacterium]|nr:hypothetical protein [Tepidisphaeraceae bacterium]